MVDLPMRSLGGQSSGEKQTYSMSVLLEENAALRKRVKELEDDDSFCDRSTIISTLDDRNELEAEIVTLRKELKKLEHEKADMEMEFMNQMASLERENLSTVELLKEKLAESREENIALREFWASGENVENLKNTIDELKLTHETEIQQLQEDLAAADKDIEHYRQDVEEMREQMEELENMKMTLLDEVTSLRVQLDEETKAATALKTQLQEVESESDARIAKLEEDLLNQEKSIEHQQAEIGEMNDKVIGLEDQKAMLLDEITGLRMQVEREQDVSASFKARLDEMTTTEERTTNDEGDATAPRLDALREQVKEMETRATKAQERVDELQLELRSVTTSYKSDVARLEESLSAKEKDIAEKSRLVDLLQESLKEEQDRRANVMSEFEEIKEKFDTVSKAAAERECEIASLNQQRVSYEKRTTQNIMDQVAEVDYHKSQNKKLTEELKSVKEKLVAEKEAAAKLRMEIADLKGLANVKGSGARMIAMRPTAANQCPESPPPSTIQSSWQRVFRSGAVEESTMSPRTPVKGIVESFERRISLSSSQHSSSGAPSSFHLVSRSSPASVPDDLPLLTLEAQLEGLRRDLEEERQKVRYLQDKLGQECETSAELRAEMATLSATEVAMAEGNRRDLEKKQMTDKEQISRLTTQVMTLEKELDNALTQVEELKKELKMHTSNRSTYEESKLAEYEKRAAKNQKAYDVELNNLKVELTKVLMIKADMELEYTNKVKEMEDSYDAMHAEVEEELEANRKQIEELEHLLETREDEIDRLKREREQLCMSMNSMSSSKRGEMEELQTELMDMSAKTTSQAREIQALKMKIEEMEFRREDTDMLRRKVLELEGQLKNGKGSRMHMTNAELEKLSQENSKLRESLRTVTLERRSLQEKLTTAVSDKDSSRSLQVLRERNASLVKEVEKLTKRLKKVEGSITRVAI